MQVTVNLDELKDLADRLKTFNTQEKDEFFEKCSKELAARLLAKLIKKTPTGKKPKHLTDSPKTVKVKGSSGKMRTFVSSDAATLQRYWSGYVGGSLRRGWTGGKKASATSYSNNLQVVKNGNTYSITLENTEPYGEYVEYGHRQEKGRFVPQINRRLKSGVVKGRYMMRDSTKEVAAISQLLLEKQINQKLKEVFGG